MAETRESTTTEESGLDMGGFMTGLDGEAPEHVQVVCEHWPNFVAAVTRYAKSLKQAEAAEVATGVEHYMAAYRARDFNAERMIEKQALRVRDAIVMAAERSFGAGQSLSIDNREVDGLIFDDPADGFRCVRDDFLPGAIWNHLWAKFGGEAGERLALVQLADALAEGLEVDKRLSTIRQTKGNTSFLLAYKVRASYMERGKTEMDQIEMTGLLVQLERWTQCCRADWASALGRSFAQAANAIHRSRHGSLLSGHDPLRFGSVTVKTQGNGVRLTLPRHIGDDLGAWIAAYRSAH